MRRKAIQSVVALRGHADELGGRREVTRRARGANKGVTERVAVEEAVQVRADDEPVLADRAIRHDIGLARAKDLAEPLGAFEVARLAHVDLVARGAYRTNQLSEQAQVGPGC